MIFLHGALGSASQLKHLAEAMDESNASMPDLGGHGTKPITPGQKFSIRFFAEEVLTLMNEQGIDRSDFFGYSMGGYIALYLARHYPERTGKIITLATKFEWTEAIAAREIAMLNPEKILAKLPAFARTLEERHSAPNSWKDNMQQTAAMMKNLGERSELAEDDYTEIQSPVLVLIGDRDKMVTLNETLDAFRRLPNAQLGVLPATPHPVEQVDVALLSALCKRFLHS